TDAAMEQMTAKISCQDSQNFVLFQLDTANETVNLDCKMSVKTLKAAAFDQNTGLHIFSLTAKMQIKGTTILNVEFEVPDSTEFPGGMLQIVQVEITNNGNTTTSRL